MTFPSGVTLITPGDQALTVTDTVSGITGSATITVTSPAAPPGGRGRAEPVDLLDGLLVGGQIVTAGSRS
jgi:hypothetical protein